MLNSDDSHSGHRQRLRGRFLASEARRLSESQLLELLLTYATSRRAAAPLARQLLERFGDLSTVLSTSHQELLAVQSIGEQAAILVQLVARLSDEVQVGAGPEVDKAGQPVLPEVEPALGPLFDQTRELERVENRWHIVLGLRRRWIAFQSHDQ
jgi:hypothetical protein